MIEFRIKKAGYKSSMHLFLDEAISEVYQASKGYPRRITMLCHRLLKELILKNKVVVDANFVKSIIRKDIQSGWHHDDALNREQALVYQFQR